MAFERRFAAHQCRGWGDSTVRRRRTAAPAGERLPGAATGCGGAQMDGDCEDQRQRLVDLFAAGLYRPRL